MSIWLCVTSQKYTSNKVLYATGIEGILEILLPSGLNCLLMVCSSYNSKPIIFCLIIQNSRVLSGPSLECYGFGLVY